jgi:hypothetical protein
VAIVAASYVAGRLLAAAGLAAIGPAAGAPSLPGELAAGVLAGACLALLARRVAGPAGTRVFAVGLTAYAGVAAVMIEGSVFAPELSPIDQLPIGLLLQMPVSFASAAVAVSVVCDPGSRGSTPT